MFLVAIPFTSGLGFLLKEENMLYKYEDEYVAIPFTSGLGFLPDIMMRVANFDAFVAIPFTSGLGFLRSNARQ